jgi:hypothetical protein
MRFACGLGPVPSARRLWLTLVACSGLLAVSGCVTASPAPSTYEDKAKLSVEAALSEVASVQTNLEQLNRDRAFRPAVLAQLRYSEDGVDAAARAFTELNPPRSDDRLRARTDSLLTAAGDTLAQTRIAVERNEQKRFGALIGDLKTLATHLDSLDKQVGS